MVNILSKSCRFDDILMSPIIASPQNSTNVKMEIHLVEDTKKNLNNLKKNTSHDV